MCTYASPSRGHACRSSQLREDGGNLGTRSRTRQVVSKHQTSQGKRSRSPHLSRSSHARQFEHGTYTGNQPTNQSVSHDVRASTLNDDLPLYLSCSTFYVYVCAHAGPEPRKLQHPFFLFFHVCADGTTHAFMPQTPPDGKGLRKHIIQTVRRLDRSEPRLPGATLRSNPPG